VACFAGALVQVLFAFTPADLAAETGKIASVGLLTLLTATQFAVFSAPFVCLAAGFGEWQPVRNWIYYALAGIAVAITGFLVQYSGETGGLTIFNDYALKAFLTTGFVAGFAYWLVAGRNAGADPDTDPVTDG
jgi:hypothetical protein